MEENKGSSIVRQPQEISNMSLVWLSKGKKQEPLGIIQHRLRYRIIQALQERFREILIKGGSPAPGEIKKEVIRIKTSSVMKNTRNGIYVRNEALKLLTHVFSYCTEKGKIHDFVMITDIVTAADEPETHRGEIEMTVNDTFIRLFLSHSKWMNIYDADLACSFDRIQTMRLYEILAGRTKTFRISYRMLLDKLGIMNEGTRARDFDKNILRTAQKELHEKAPFSFVFQREKDGDDWVYSFTTVQKDRADADDQSPERDRLVKDSALSSALVWLSSIGFTENELKGKNIDTVKEYLLLPIRGNKAKLENFWKMSNMSGVGNPKGYFMKLLQLTVEEYRK